MISISKNVEKKDFQAFYLLFKENSLDEQDKEAMAGQRRPRRSWGRKKAKDEAKENKAKEDEAK